MTIPYAHKRELYAYLFGIIRNMKCFLLRMNGMSDHVHILVDVHPTVALAELVKTMKQSSSHWLQQSSSFPNFIGWADGYYAVSIGVDGVDACKNYIINQEIHHSSVDMLTEMQIMARDNGLTWYEDDWK